MAKHLPVVYLAFANALDDHLAKLKEESREIFKSLHGLQKDNKIWVHREESSQVDELYEDLMAYDQDIVIFHYGGHADGSMLQLEGGAGAAGGLASLLGQQKNLKLVFLNGCATKDQVNLLHRAGVPAVIATAVKINDSKATIFSTAFYKSLAKGNSIEDSFNSAKNLLETKFSSDDLFEISFNRGPPVWDFDEEDEASAEVDEEMEWRLYIRPEASTDLGRWRLNTAQTEWRIQLRDRRGHIRSTLDDEPVTVEHRAVVRTLPAASCTECGVIRLDASVLENGENVCPVCHSKAINLGDAATELPDKVLEYEVSSKQARAAAIELLEAQFNKGKFSKQIEIEQILPLWVPCWKFDAQVHSEYKGESAVAAGFQNAIPELTWRSAGNHMDSSLDDYLVAGSITSWAQVDDQHWDFDTARDYQADDSAGSSLPLSINLEGAFEVAAGELRTYLEAEVAERLGGLEQRNVELESRYDQVRAELYWLPHYLVAAVYKEENASLLINGQSGETRFTRQAKSPGDSGGVNRFMKGKLFAKGSGTTRAELWVSVFSGVGIGIMIGLLLGLAAPQAGEESRSTVSIFIGALGVGLAALLGLNDRHFSMAKGLRIGSFGLAVAIAAMSGIVIRDGGFLSPDGPTVLYDVAPPTYSEPVDSGGNSAPVDVETIIVRDNPGSGRSYLYSSELDLDVCGELKTPYDQDLSEADLISNFKLNGGDGWSEFAGEIESQVILADQKAALLTGRDAICGFGNFQDIPVQASPAACFDLAQMQQTDSKQQYQDLLDWHGLSSFYNKTAGSIPEASLPQTLSIIATMLCAESAQDQSTTNQ
ncbi:MAG: CHAT domain-containing protein [Arenicella sp.]|nr:CHAT domain-containing protein [Arenicella sp.]